MITLIVHSTKKFIKTIMDKVSFTGFVAICAFLLFFLWDFIILGINHSLAYYWVEQGDRAYQHSKYLDAISYYEHALRLYPEHYMARYNLGNIYVAYEDYEKAVECYTETLKYKRDFTKARIDLGIVLAEKLYELDRAISEYKIVATAKPDMSRLKEQKEDKAIAYYNMGIAFKDKSILLGDDRINIRRELSNAVEAYENSLKLRPSDYDTFYNLALTYQLLGDYPNAKKYYCKAINLKPFNYESHYNFAILLSQNKRLYESIEELEKAGLILDSTSDSYLTVFVYDVLNDVTQKAIAKNGTSGFVKNYETHFDSKTEEIHYRNGRVVIPDELDEKILKNMKSCELCKEHD